MTYTARDRYPANPFIYENLDCDCILRTQVITASTNIVDGATSTVDLTGFPQMGIKVQCTSTVAVEVQLGGPTISTIPADGTIARIGLGNEYKVNVSDVALFDIGRNVEVYDVTSSNGVLLAGKITRKINASDAPIESGVGFIVVSAWTANTPTNAAAGDVIGGPNRFVENFTAGTGFVVHPNSSSPLIYPIRWGYMFLRVVGASGTASYRIIQVQ